MNILIPLLIIVVNLIVLVLIFKVDGTNLTFFKKNISLIISYAINVIIIYTICCSIFTIKSDSSIVIFINKYVYFMLSCGISIVTSAPVFILIHKIKEKKIINEKELKYKVDKYIYYRDYLNNISPAMVYVIYNQKINMKDLIVASYIYMSENGLIITEDSKICRTDKQANYSHEDYIMGYLMGNIKFDNFKKNLKSYLKQDLLDNHYIYTSKERNSDVSVFLGKIMVFLIISFLIFVEGIAQVCENGILLFVAYFFAFLGLPIYNLLMNTINPVIRTEENLILYSKLNGLKKFLKDFTIIKDRTVDEIKLYDDYILYAIIFDFKGNLNKECKKEYSNLLKKIEYNQKLNNF